MNDDQKQDERIDELVPDDDREELGRYLHQRGLVLDPKTGKPVEPEEGK